MLASTEISRGFNGRTAYKRCGCIGVREGCSPPGSTAQRASPRKSRFPLFQSFMLEVKAWLQGASREGVGSGGEGVGQGKVTVLLWGGSKLFPQGEGGNSAKFNLIFGLN